MVHPNAAAQVSGQLHKKTGLILSGGGARAAYQVGVLKAISEIIPKDAHNPFHIICGTSAGAINAVALATHASRFRIGVLGLEAIWRNFHAEQIYRTDFRALSGRALRWLSALFLGGIGARRPVSLLDNDPLKQLVGRLLRFERIQHAIEAGDLHAVSITCSGYSTGESVSFFEGRHELKGWRRARRVGTPTKLKLEHLIASSAIPIVFPAVKINREYFGDGSVRQLAPISPALHLGADRVLVIGVSGNAEIHARIKGQGYPTVAQVAGHVLNSAFLDSLAGDVERLERINRTIGMIPEETREAAGLELRPIDVLKISPSQGLDEIAGRYAHELPRSIRFFLRGSDAAKQGSTILSYLLFEPGFCRALIKLGYEDAMRLETQILHFLGYDPRALHGAAGLPAADTC